MHGFKLRSPTTIAATMSWFSESLKPHCDHNCGNIGRICPQYQGSRRNRKSDRNLKPYFLVYFNLALNWVCIFCMFFYSVVVLLSGA